ncbi:hypothetical protein SH580_13190 [Coraliomargarita algicola]|uniref:Lipoprotein n=1 Tax=Coraliomargarita algicola TaxID=3092156 RepID=A0ABZ0RH05_9BACT|nr:hypothetical protein [Coraliomargarita sp. J2-16]WPJ94388.1 hypothetical protein SH580_13190 [Coraliomargarita sp. J2-16]
MRKLKYKSLLAIAIISCAGCSDSDTTITGTSSSDWPDEALLEVNCPNSSDGEWTESNFSTFGRPLLSGFLKSDPPSFLNDCTAYTGFYPDYWSEKDKTLALLLGFRQIQIKNGELYTMVRFTGIDDILEKYAPGYKQAIEYKQRVKWNSPRKVDIGEIIDVRLGQSVFLNFNDSERTDTKHHPLGFLLKTHDSNIEKATQHEFFSPATAAKAINSAASTFTLCFENCHGT